MPFSLYASQCISILALFFYLQLTANTLDGMHRELLLKEMAFPYTHGSSVHFTSHCLCQVTAFSFSPLHNLETWELTEK